MKPLAFLVLLSALCQGSPSGGNEDDCDVRKCIADLEQALNQPYTCHDLYREIQEAVAPCRKSYCTEEVRQELEPYGKVISEELGGRNCTVQMGRSCSMTELFTCVSGASNFLIIIPNLQVTDLSKLCLDLKKMYASLHTCQKCIEMEIPGFEAWTADVQRIIDVVITLLNGGCDCTRMLVEIVRKRNTTTECGSFTLLSGFAKVLASDCAIKLINYPLQLDWLTMVDKYIRFFFPFASSFVCAATAYSINMKLLAASMVLLFLTCKRFCYF